MIVAGTSSQTRKLHVNQTCVEVSVLQKSWWCGMCSSRNCSVPNVVVSVTKAMSGSVTKTLVDGFHHANHHLSKRASQILVVLWRKLRQRPPNPSFNALHYHVLKHTVRERLWSGWVVSHTLELLSCLFQQRQSSTGLRTVCCWSATDETPGLTQSTTVRTANWLRHLPAPHRHVDDRCSDSGEPLERQRQH